MTDRAPHRERRVATGVVVALLAVAAVRAAVRPGTEHLAVTLAAAVLAAGAATVALRDRRLLLVGAVVATAGIAVVGAGSASNVVFFGVCVLAAWCALQAGPRVGGAYWLVAIVLFAGEWVAGERVAGNGDGGWAAWLAGTTFSTVVGLLAGRERALLVQLRAAQHDLLDAARAEERLRISRELHDVVAHCLVVSLLHVSSARVALEEEPEDAARSLAEAERLGRESLAEVRRAVGRLRPDGGRPETAPLPTAADLGALVDRVRSAGADVELHTEGDLTDLPPTTGLGLYRITQEALTNAVKHAPGATTTVRVTRSATGVQLSVDTAGPPGTGRGVGLVTMRERADSLGGSCHAGPGGRGWLVRADLPADPTPAPASVPAALAASTP